MYYSLKNLIIVTVLILSISSIIISGCGGGGGGTSITTDPVLTPTTASSSTMSGYVYYTETASSSSKATKKAICSNTKITSAGYTAINNCTITIKANGQKCHSDSEGHFQTNVTGNVSDYNCHIDPSTSTNASDITPFEQNLFSFVNSYLSTPVSGFEIKMKVSNVSDGSKIGNTNISRDVYNPVLHYGKSYQYYAEIKLGNAYVDYPVEWSCDSSIGNIDPNGVFTAVNNSASGKVYATVGSSVGESNVTIVKNKDGKSFFGCTFKFHDILIGSKVKLSQNDVVKYSGVTDSIGYYSTDIDNGSYVVEVGDPNQYIKESLTASNGVYLSQVSLTEPVSPILIPTLSAVIPTVNPYIRGNVA